MGIVVQSGLIYTTCAFITCVMFIDSSPAVFVTANAGTHAVGIAFNLIIIRVAMDDNFTGTVQSTNAPGLSELRFESNATTARDEVEHKRSSLAQGGKASRKFPDI
ncbi:hypothetical protein VNI00_006502 [Paramarasmius palmivorus]|uniref:Uncharacterized protein n=1 Tax=Paramarasmius palmivorus TaxID=297713 RepID=A0AAW0D4D0_9AGAR